MSHQGLGNANSFSITRLPRIEFGRGKFLLLAEIIKPYGDNVLLITGKSSFSKTKHWNELLKLFQVNNIHWTHISILSEPSPARVDEIVATHADKEIDVVLAIGGGSVLDAAKAVAGLIKNQQSVLDFLEGVGPELDYTGPSIPFIALPTTAGTGSEVTKNAVLGVVGKKGFKKSFRDESLLAEVAIIDPELLANCPPALIAANGMDALTQLIESFVSSKSNPLTDALIIATLPNIGKSLLSWFENVGDIETAQNDLAFSAMISGITLAQVGLGSVHGLASPLGAYFSIPHGVACGSLLAAATAVNIQAMREREPNNTALEKYARISTLLTAKLYDSDEQAQRALIDVLIQWTQVLNIPSLNSYGLTERDLSHIVANSRGSSMKTNPIELKDEEIASILIKSITHMRPSHEKYGYH